MSQILPGLAIALAMEAVKKDYKPQINADETDQNHGTRLLE